jgi:hypothetical protein
MAKKKAVRLPATSVLDYPSSLSLYERESLAAEAKLDAEKKTKIRPNPDRKDRTMALDPKDRNSTEEEWRELARRAIEEKDSKKIAALTKQVILKFDEPKRRKM